MSETVEHVARMTALDADIAMSADTLRTLARHDVADTSVRNEAAGAGLHEFL